MGWLLLQIKLKGSYAALAFTEKHAQMAKNDDNANILCLDSDYEDFETHKKIVIAFLTTPFSNEERHQTKV